MCHQQTSAGYEKAIACHLEWRKSEFFREAIHVPNRTKETALNFHQ
jgi:hypothetical protein